MKVANPSPTSNRRIPFKNPTSLILEDEYISKNPQEVKNLLLKEFHFIPKDFGKTQKILWIYFGRFKAFKYLPKFPKI